jgi:hypothetical protein
VCQLGHIATRYGVTWRDMALIDKYLPVFQFNERHQLLMDALPAGLLDEVTLSDASDDPWVRAFISLRELPDRFLGALGRGSALKNRAAFGLHDFTLLGRDSDREIVFGLVGKFWQFDYGLVAMNNSDEFERFTVVGVPKLVLNFRLESLDNGQARLLTETRVFCNDRKSFIRFLPYWWIIRPVSGFMRRRLLVRIRNAAAARAN